MAYDNKVYEKTKELAEVIEKNNLTYDDLFLDENTCDELNEDLELVKRTLLKIRNTFQKAQNKAVLAYVKKVGEEYFDGDIPFEIQDRDRYTTVLFDYLKENIHDIYGSLYVIETTLWESINEND